MPWLRLVLGRGRGGDIQWGCCKRGQPWVGQGEGVALYEDGGTPPLCPGVVSSGVRSKSWGADGVDLGYSGVGRVL